ncbi:MAG: hypothetical protein J6B68_01720 [Lachnospiraceae bacterium]|nr:hypothetical protein [Lachnospiraceae bacterium]MBP3477565.1 hypothetical protein [Lachnospiraceae bacterium]
MYRFTTYAKRKTNTEREPTLSIIDLIPVGRENAISRQMLTDKCVSVGLIDKSISDKDRAMRRLVEKARLDYTILNISDGNGYYRVSWEDLQDLQRYIRQEDSRAKAAFRNHALAKKLYEDYKAGRIKDDKEVEECKTENT